MMVLRGSSIEYKMRFEVLLFVNSQIVLDLFHQTGGELFAIIMHFQTHLGPA